MVVALLSTLIVGAVTLAIVAAVAFFRSEAGSLPALLKKMAEIIEGARASIPLALAEQIPPSTRNRSRPPPLAGCAATRQTSNWWARRRGAPSPTS
ncbi:MAG: hypothetical protein MZW92_29265 [Comamonadaceae bacterium]|nr:hypothetical protein [Comamonadaceae bacterium]